jgi:hypothetical protein
VIGLAPVSHGAAALAGLCGGPCAPATRQGIPGSRFLAALNGGDETPGRLPYSAISSTKDIVGPPSTSNLDGDRDDSNSVVQAICPGRSLDHGHIQYDAVAVALVLDALRHDGPARASRVPAATCAKRYADGIDPDEVERDIAAGLAYFAANYGRAGLTETESPLKEYARRPAPRPTAALKIDPRRLRAGQRTRVSLLATGTSGRQRWPLARARIEIAGRKATTDAHGRASLRLRLRRPGHLRARLVAPGLAPVTRHLRVGGREIGR